MWVLTPCQAPGLRGLAPVPARPRRTQVCSSAVAVVAVGRLVPEEQGPEAQGRPSPFVAHTSGRALPLPRAPVLARFTHQAAARGFSTLGVNIRLLKPIPGFRNDRTGFHQISSPFKPKAQQLCGVSSPGSRPRSRALSSQACCLDACHAACCSACSAFTWCDAAPERLPRPDFPRTPYASRPSLLLRARHEARPVGIPCVCQGQTGRAETNMLKSVEWSLEQPEGQIWDWSAGLELLGPELCRARARPLEPRSLFLARPSPRRMGGTCPSGVGLPVTPSQCLWSFGGLAFLRARQRAQPDP